MTDSIEQIMDIIFTTAGNFGAERDLFLGNHLKKTHYLYWIWP